MTTTTVCAGSGTAPGRAPVADGEALPAAGRPVPADVADADPAWPAGPPGAGPEPLQLASASNATPTNTLAALALDRRAAPARSRPDRSVRACSQPDLRLNSAFTLPEGLENTFILRHGPGSNADARSS